MKKLILVRHSKAEKGLNIADIDRPLTLVGVERAHLLARVLKRVLKESPEYWLSSSANRALHTATIFGEAFDSCNKININAGLYTFEHCELLKIINQIPLTVDSAILFGHNNAFIDVVNQYSDNYVEEFKPCSIAIINIHDERWEATENATLERLITKDRIDEL